MSTAAIARNSIVNLEPSREVKARDIYLIDEITMNPVGRVTQAFIEAQNDQDIEQIRLYLFTGGGSVNAGFALYDLIQCSLKPVTVIAHGACMSMGITILQAATRRLATAHCNLMIHPVTNSGGSQSTNLEQMTQDTEILRRRDEENARAVCARAGMSLAQYRKFMGVIRYLTPQEALGVGKYGLIDGIVG